MRIYHAVLFAVVTGTLLPIWLHYRAFGGFDPDQMAMAFFLWLNTIIAFWEICLFLRIGQIEEQHRRFVSEYRGRELARVKDFFFAPLPLGKVFSPSTWAELWSSYSVFDESYADHKSYGFFIDVGNGFSTLVPSLFALYGMTYQVLPARAFAILLLILNYQMWYGTVVYAGSYIFHKRYRGHSPINVAAFVGLSNGLWLGFPMWGMYLAVKMIYAGTYAVFLP